jgi:hypothetical protein
VPGWWPLSELVPQFALQDHGRPYVGRAGQDLVDLIDRDGIVAGMRHSVEDLRGCPKRFENRVIRMRDADEETRVPALGHLFVTISGRHGRTKRGDPVLAENST